MKGKYMHYYRHTHTNLSIIIIYYIVILFIIILIYNIKYVFTVLLGYIFYTLNAKQHFHHGSQIFHIIKESPDPLLTPSYLPTVFSSDISAMHWKVTFVDAFETVAYQSHALFPQYIQISVKKSSNGTFQITLPNLQSQFILSLSLPCFLNNAYHFWAHSLTQLLMDVQSLPSIRM